MFCSVYFDWTDLRRKSAVRLWSHLTASLPLTPCLPCCGSAFYQPWDRCVYAKMSWHFSQYATPSLSLSLLLQSPCCAALDLGVNSNDPPPAVHLFAASLMTLLRNPGGGLTPHGGGGSQRGIYMKHPCVDQCVFHSIKPQHKLQ